MIRRALLSAWLFAAGCSADSAVAPEPEVGTPGAFVATYAEGRFRLFRSLGTATYFGDSFVVMLVYDVTPSSWDDARALAKRPGLPTRERVQYGAFARLPEHRAVWFRTLSPAEEGARFK